MFRWDTVSEIRTKSSPCAAFSRASLSAQLQFNQKLFCGRPKGGTLQSLRDEFLEGFADGREAASLLSYALLLFEHGLLKTAEYFGLCCFD